MTELVSYRLADGIATITMDDGKVNALSFDMLGQIGAALDRAEADGAVVVLAGREGRFSAGFDLSVLTAGNAESVKLLITGFELSERLLTFPRPVVIACTGHAIAMGLFLVLSGDFRVGSAGPFKLVANEVAIGMVLPMGAVEMCRQRLSPAAFDRMVNLAEPCPADDAAVVAGVVDQIVDPDLVLATAQAAAERFATLHPTAHAETKRRARRAGLAAIRAGIEADEAEFAAALGLA